MKASKVAANSWEVVLVLTQQEAKLLYNALDKSFLTKSVEDDDKYFGHDGIGNLFQDVFNNLKPIFKETDNETG